MLIDGRDATAQFLLIYSCVSLVELYLRYTWYVHFPDVLVTVLVVLEVRSCVVLVLGIVLLSVLGIFVFSYPWCLLTCLVVYPLYSCCLEPACILVSPLLLKQTTLSTIPSAVSADAWA